MITTKQMRENVLDIVNRKPGRMIGRELVQRVGNKHVTLYNVEYGMQYQIPLKSFHDQWYYKF